MESDGEYRPWYGGATAWLFPGYRGCWSHAHGLLAFWKATWPPGAGLVNGPCGGGNRGLHAGLGEKEGSTGVRLS